MKQSLLFSAMLSIVFISASMKAQTTTPFTGTHSNHIPAAGKLFSTSDTITFTGLADGAVVTDQYLHKGVLFSGFDGSGDPVIADFSADFSFGNALHSDTWYNPLMMTFVDTSG